MMGVMGRVGESVKVRALYLTPGQVETLASRFPEISKSQVVISWVGYKDTMTFKVELVDETIDRDKLSTELKAGFQDVCRLRLDKIDFVPPGTIPEEHKTIVDERSWRVGDKRGQVYPGR
jgi:phenylacetate-CoA ligase